MKQSDVSSMIDSARPRRLSVLGSTGSIGKNTLDVMARHPGRYRAFALTASTQVDLMAEQCLAFRPRYAVMASAPHATALRERLQNHKPAFAYLIPTFQNPSAVRYSETKRDAVAALLDEFGVTLIEDEPYRELVFDDGSATPIVSRLKQASWIYTGTVSKTLLPGLRVGYLIATPDLYPYLLRLKQSADLHTNRIGQWQALQWLGTRHYREHLAELRDFYRVRRDAMQDVLVEHFSDLADWQIPQGGLFFWLTLKQPLDTRTLLDAALAQNVAFMPGEPFFIDPDANPGHLRLNFSHVAPERLSEGLRRLAAVIRDAQNL